MNEIEKDCNKTRVEFDMQLSITLLISFCACVFSFQLQSLRKINALPKSSLGNLRFRVQRNQWLSAVPAAADQSDAVCVTDDPPTGWSSALSMKTDLAEAVEEVVNTAKTVASGKSPTVAMFYVSSIYEASASDYDVIFKAIRRAVPSVQHIIGATTGCAIGSTQPGKDPIEVEARASISLVLADLSADGISGTVRYLSSEDIDAYINSTDNTAPPLFAAAEDGDGERPALLLSSDSSKKKLTQLLSTMETRERIFGFGAVASVVTSLHTPRVFISTADAPDTWQKHTSGVVALVLDGDVQVKTVVARSCLPVGPMYAITKRDGPDVLETQVRINTWYYVIY